MTSTSGRSPRAAEAQRARSLLGGVGAGRSARRAPRRSRPSRSPPRGCRRGSGRRASKSRSAYSAASRVSPPTVNVASPAGTSLTNATFGLSGPPREREADQQRDEHRVRDEQPDEQRRAAQDLQVLDEQPAHQWPRSWRNATKAASKSRSRGPTAVSSSRGRAAEQQLAVGQDEHAVGVARGLGEVVRGEDDRRARRGRAGRGTPTRAGGGAGRAPTTARRAAAPAGRRAGRWRCSPAGGCRPTACPSSSRARSVRPVCSSARATAASTSATFSSRANSRRFSATVSLRVDGGLLRAPSRPSRAVGGCTVARRSARRSRRGSTAASSCPRRSGR